MHFIDCICLDFIQFIILLGCIHPSSNKNEKEADSCDRIKYMYLKKYIYFFNCRQSL